MIKVENLSYAFPQKELFDKISFHLEEGHHCAFIGSSGSGKSTLIDILMDPERFMYDGSLAIDPNCRMGYISQFSQLDPGNKTTVFEYIAETFIRLQHEMDTLCKQMETSSYIDTLLQSYQEALDAFDAIDGNNYESNINKKLNIANLNKHRDLPVSDLSGGEFKLIQVIKEMMNAPTLLIMDEPDVFLDFENLNALEALINSHKGMLLIVTHNRFLLNHCFNKIIHLENKDLQEFEGTYSNYTFSLLERKIELQEQSVADDEEIARYDFLIHQLRAIATQNTEASRGRALKARVKVQERLIANRIKAPFVEIKQPYIQFPELVENALAETIGIALTGHHMAFDEVLLDNATIEIGATDKVALIGSNGSGKTTLLREIYHNDSRTIAIHPELKMAYLSQKNEEVLSNNQQSISDFFLDEGFNSLQAIKSHVSKYGFNEESSEQKIGSLSGGEKNILQLAHIAASSANFLLLDEPTSHLDTYAQMALEKALKAYKGGVLMVSHDYYTIANCMDYVLIIEDKTIRRMSLRKFRKTIYASHFPQEYLLLDEKKKALETRIEQALQETNFETAKLLCEELAAFYA